MDMKVENKVEMSPPRSGGSGKLEAANNSRLVNYKFLSPYFRPSIKLSTYDGKSSWQVYKIQFAIVADEYG